MRLGVNIDHVATLRQARGTKYPEPATAAAIAELAGADGIVCHLREDRRHINDRDLRILREVVQGRLNLEMAATEEMVGICLSTRPHVATLVPERRQEQTTERGLDVVAQADLLKSAVERLKEGGILVSLFIDCEHEQVRAAHRLGVEQVEFHTGPLTSAADRTESKKEFRKLVDSSRLAAKLGISVAAGHGLDYFNVGQVAAIPEVEELNIGHSIISRAVLTGLEAAVSEMKAIIAEFATQDLSQ